MKHTLRRTGAILTAASLAGLATVAPAYAADGPGGTDGTVARSAANAVTIGVAGTENGSGTVTATHDGERRTITGETNPALGVLGGQDLLDVGTLAQDADVRLRGRDGLSAACAGVAGDGASLLQVGEGRCLTPGGNVGISMGNLDLTGAVLFDPETALGPLSALEPIMDQVVEPVSAQLSSALAAVPVRLGGSAEVIQAWCAAEPGTARGDAEVTDARLTATVGDRTVTLVDLPTGTAPNTEVVTDLDEVVNAVLAALEVQLTEGLEGALEPLTAVTAAVREQIVDAVIGQVADQLAPLEENLVSVTLNEQRRPADGRIEVTALDLQLLPAAQEFVGSSLVSASIGNVECGPSSRVAADQPDAPDAPDASDAPAPLPDVPSVIDAGAEPAASSTGSWETALYAGGAVAAAGLTGLAGYRRLLARR